MCGQNQYDNGETGLDNPRILRHAFNALLPRYNAYPKLVEALSHAVGLVEHAKCPECDGSGGFYDGYGGACQCQWCHEKGQVQDLLKELCEL
jgi:hypothetical protein